jgi:hypothetical protein
MSLSVISTTSTIKIKRLTCGGFLDAGIGHHCPSLLG